MSEMNVIWSLVKIDPYFYGLLISLFLGMILSGIFLRIFYDFWLKTKIEKCKKKTQDRIVVLSVIGIIFIFLILVCLGIGIRKNVLINISENIGVHDCVNVCHTKAATNETVCYSNC